MLFCQINTFLKSNCYSNTEDVKTGAAQQGEKYKVKWTWINMIVFLFFRENM